MSDGREPPWFLQRLALDGTADQRAIRRAYAREVKRIDQGADAQGFQLLREAYETALRWEEFQRIYARQEAASPDADASEGTAAPDLAPVQAQAARSAAPDGHGDDARHRAPAEPVQADALQIDALQTDPQQLSADVFEAFMAGCSGLAQGRTLHDAPAWELHLRTCLNDDRMMNLAARGIFEARVLHLLAGGWRPGNETLLEAAADVFQWRRDRHRLLRFGHAGAIVDRGIDERSMFDNQERDLKAVQRQVILRLREPDLPEPAQLRADMPHVEQLAARFPTWLELVASMDNLEQWRSAYATLPAPAAPPGYGAVPSAWTASAAAHYATHAAGGGVDDGGTDGGGNGHHRPARAPARDRIKKIAWRFVLGFIAFNVALALLRAFVIPDTPPGKAEQATIAQPKRQPDIVHETPGKNVAAHRAEREAGQAQEGAAARARPETTPPAPPP
jgi:hypothetical protein